MNAAFLTLADIRHRATRIFVVLCRLHVPVAVAVALIARNPIAMPAAMAAGAGVAASFAAWRLRTGPSCAR